MFDRMHIVLNLFLKINFFSVSFRARGSFTNNYLTELNVEIPELDRTQLVN